MIRIFIFWLIVAPCSLAFFLGLLANVTQKMASEPTEEPKPETSQ